MVLTKLLLPYKFSCMNSHVDVVDDRERAEVLLHPLRLRILESARDPGSAAELARRLDETPQKVNYHVRRLAEHGFLEVVEERRVGHVVETVWRAGASFYVLGTALLGGLAPPVEGPGAGTAVRWLGIQARAEAELAPQLRRAAESGGVVPAFTLDEEFRFETPEQRATFARAIRDLFRAAVSKYTTRPGAGESGGRGRAYRLVIGSYPIP